MSRNRSHEPTELRRAELRAQKKCIGCGEPSDTVRCTECTRRIESNTERYHGRGKPGRTSFIEANLSDMRYAVDALTKAWRGHSEVQELGPLSPRKRDELLAEPLAQVHLAWKFLGELLGRAGVIKSRAAKPPRAPRPRCAPKPPKPPRPPARAKRTARADTPDPRQMTFTW